MLVPTYAVIVEQGRVVIYEVSPNTGERLRPLHSFTPKDGSDAKEVAHALRCGFSAGWRAAIAEAGAMPFVIEARS